MNIKTFFTLIITLFFLKSKTCAQIKIPLSPSNIISIYGIGTPAGLLDEQTLAANPIIIGQGGLVLTDYNPITAALQVYYPYYKVVVDLGTTFNITNISLYDGSNSDSLWIRSGNPSNFQPLVTITTNQYNAWRNFAVNTSSRYLEVTLKSAGSVIKEMVVYGTQTGTITPPPGITNHPLPLFNKFMGTNGLHVDNINYSKCVDFVREYHNWQWDEGNTSTTYPGYPNNQYAWNPSWVSGSNWAWNFDAYYDTMNVHGLTVSPCLQRSTPYISNFNSNSIESKPLSAGENPFLPSSYIEHADYLFQFTSRYGNITHPANQLKLKSNNQQLSGLGKVKWVENWNEPDKSWEGAAGYFNAYHYAAMSSADYDGHLGSLGAAKGIKAGDSTMKFAMSGIISLNLNYIKGLKFWCDHFRNGDFMYDAINFHHYSNNAGGQASASPTIGISPEADSLYYKSKKLVDYRNQYLPNVEVWVSEFGYDTHAGSTQRAPAIGPNDAQEVQGEWIVRSFLAFSAAGVDKAIQFMLVDNNGTSGGTFASSGLIYYPGSGNVYTPKKSWYYVYTTKNVLTNYKFDAIISSGNSPVWVYRFINTTNSNKAVYAVWCPSSNNTIVNNYALTLGATTATQCVQTLLDPTSSVGTSSLLPIIGNTATFTVTERPQFLEVTYASIPTGIGSHVLNNNFLIYPNPSNSSVTLKYENKLGTISIINSLGQTVLQKNCAAKSTEVDISAFKPGVYFVKITNEEGSIVKQLLIN